MTNFNQAQQDLLAISGKSAEQLAGLTAQAKELGATTAFSATEITGLQIELAKLGFTTDEILQGTGGISAFASATGADLPQAAKLAGSALRAFNLDASEMDRVVSVLGVATTKTALDVSALETGLSSVAPVAASFGFSIEDTTALLGQLSNAGFDASSAATSTRNILLNLADANGSLAKELGRPIKSADDLAGALKELQEKGIDLGEALELTDKRSVAAFQTFMNGADSLVDLRDSITDVNDELLEMEKKRLDSVNGQLQLLASAWEGVVLGTSEATGATNAIKNTIGFLAENLNTILKVIALVGASFLSYKVVLIASKVASLASAAATQTLAIAKLLLTGNVKQAIAAMKMFNTVTKMNPIGLLITGITAAVTAFALFSDAAADARRRQKEFNDAIEQGNKQGIKSANENLTAIKGVISKKIKELEREKERQIALGQSAQEAEEIFLKKKEALVQAEIKILERRIKKASEIGKKEIKNLEKQRGEANKKVIDNLKIHNIDIDDMSTAAQKIRLSFEEKFGVMALSNQIRRQKESSRAQKKSFRDEIKNIQGQQEELLTEQIKNENESTAVSQDAARKRQNALMLLRRRAEDMEDAAIKDEFKRREQQLNRAFQREIDAIKGNSEIENRLREALEKKLTTDLLALRKERADKSVQLVEDELKRIDAAYKAQEDAEQQDIDSELEQLTGALEKRNLARELANLEAEGTDEEFNKSEKERQLKHIDEMIDLLSLYPDKETEILQLQIERKKLLRDKELENEKSFGQEMIEATQTANKVLQAEFDRRMEMEQEKATEARREQDRIRAFAAEGNDLAQESLKAQIQAERDALAEQDRIRRQKEKAQFITTALQNVQNQLANGATIGEAVSSTVALEAALRALFSGFQGFYKGTDNAPEGYAWVHEKGGEAILDKKGQLKEIGSNAGPQLRYLNKGDKVLPHNKTLDMLKNNNNLQGAERVAMMQGKSVDNTNILIRELRKNNDALKSIPKNAISAEKIGNIVKLISTEKKAGRTRINTFKIRG